MKKKVSNNWLNFLVCFFRKAVALFLETAGAFVFLAMITSVLWKVSPSFYRMTTKWVNQPALPYVKQCAFKKIESQDLQALPATKDFIRFEVEFEIDRSYGEKRSLVFFTENQDINLYPEATRSWPSIKDPPYLVIQNKFLKNKIKIEAITKEMDKYLYEEDCPIKITFF